MVPMKKFVTVLSLFLASFFVTATADAATITLNDVEGGHFATADFSVVGGNLVLTLTNTASGDVWDPAHVLTGLYFDIAGDPTLTALSATTCVNCITNLPNPDPTNVSGEWAFRQTTDLAYGGDYGVSATGLGLFGPNNLIDGANPIQAPASPGGVDFGITSQNDIASTNTGLSSTPLINNYVTFTFSGISSSFDPNSVKVTGWQYGSTLGEAVPVPEPATLMLFAPAALAALAAGRKRARRKTD